MRVVGGGGGGGRREERFSACCISGCVNAHNTHYELLFCPWQKGRGQ